MKVGILGGGLTGLVVAKSCTAHDCDILELDDQVGGHCRSLLADGYTFDLGGPHILFSRNEEILALLKRQLGPNIATRRRNNQIRYRGRFVKYPFENGLYDLSPEDRYDCLYHYLKNDHPPPTNFREWLYHVFGTGIAEKYLIPYNEKIWNVPATEMAFDWVEGRVPRPPLEDVIKSAVGVVTEGYTHQLYFTYPRTGGIEALPQSFARDCAHVTVNFRVAKVWREAGQWRVSDGRTTKSYDRIVSTIPIEDLVDALPDVPDPVRASVAGLRYNSLVTVMIGARSAAPPPYTALYVPDAGLPFHRLSFPLNFTDAVAPPGRMAVCAEITTNPGDGLHEASDDAIAGQVIDGIAAMELLQPDDVEFCRVHRTRHAYVVRTFDYPQKLKTALDYLNALGIISVGRNAEFEYINMDEAVRRGLAVAAGL